MDKSIEHNSIFLIYQVNITMFLSSVGISNAHDGSLMQREVSKKLKRIGVLGGLSAELTTMFYCTEFPMLINSENSPLPLLDSALLLAQAALDEAVY
ncbi:hypothetical protein PSTEL_17785 [Paenibacillus stellifer]|uniref:Uncharacterized protein n=1 Tax=Paenibacillus stellifer TaxID=169760 RepID=A0A089LX12_9BACL|nr:hypothetical protein PSTEL_17785 [Paenibacillus stellifer]